MKSNTPTMGSHIREEEIKNIVDKRFFADYDTTKILGNIDFAVAVPVPEGQISLFETEYLLWAEAKAGNNHNIRHSLVQLIITIGKARTFDHHLPPAFLGAFDAEKIAFLPYNTVLDIFYQNDFNWNVAPSDHTTREFALVEKTVSRTLDSEMFLFRYDQHEQELRQFIKRNFVVGKSEVSKVRINKNNFTSIYQKWRTEVMPSIAVKWEEAKKQGVIDADFYLADILSEHNTTLLQKLYVLLRGREYEFARTTDDATLFNYKLSAGFNDNQTAHNQFWQRYDRPPRREYWDYIVERRDLLVPQDVRERKGSFFTPQRWVELSQKYLADELGDDWQDHYYIWDCCAGTGNLLAGLTNKYNIYASTLDQQDVDVMRERIRHMNEQSRDGKGGSNLLDSHVFQFDFLNDPLLHERDKKGRITKRSKLPDSLQEIIIDPEKRKKLVIYINPPYAEAGDTKQITGTGKNKSGVSFNSYTYDKYKPIIGLACRELFAQFFIRVSRELPGTVLAEFSKLKILQAPNFREFRKAFQAQLGRIFLVPANTFDNVNGQFPIAFMIWHTSIEKTFSEVTANVYDREGTPIGQKIISSYLKEKNIIEWLRNYYDKSGLFLGYLRMNGTNVQNNKGIYLTDTLSENDIHNHFYTEITDRNLSVICIYLAIRQAIDAGWLNDRDQYLFPTDNWVSDLEFHTDCLIFSLFHGQNRISSKNSINHWIPFREEDVNAKERFASHFMHNFITHPIKISGNTLGAKQGSIFTDEGITTSVPTYTPIDHLSTEARAVMEAGQNLWRYYHQQPGANPNASYYDIRLHFQGTKITKSGKEQMNTDSTDPTYTTLLNTLRQAMKQLATHIEPKVYKYGFLK